MPVAHTRCVLPTMELTRCDVQCRTQAFVVKMPALSSSAGPRHSFTSLPSRNCSKVGLAVCRASSPLDAGSAAVSHDGSASSFADLLLETNGNGVSGTPKLGHRTVVDLDDDAGTQAFAVRGDTEASSPAALSAPAYTPPAAAWGRPTIKPAWITSGVLLSLAAATACYIHVAETNARKKLVYGQEKNVIVPPPPAEMVERYERARASVEQTSMINRAVGALQKNDFIKCIVEVELALEQNRTARSSVTSDFYEEGQLQRLYRTALKTWLDGYPLDYGKLLQLRELLAIPPTEAESIEADVQRQSDVYVI